MRTEVDRLTRITLPASSFIQRYDLVVGVDSHLQPPSFLHSRLESESLWQINLWQDSSHTTLIQKANGTVHNHHLKQSAMLILSRALIILMNSVITSSCKLPLCIGPSGMSNITIQPKRWYRSSAKTKVCVGERESGLGPWNTWLVWLWWWGRGKWERWSKCLATLA